MSTIVADSHSKDPDASQSIPDIREVDVIRARFAGDSGDGMQLTGTQFALSTALAGNDLATFPDYPAEIRAPVGSTFGVSAFSICFGSRGIFSHGDNPDILVAMNPAALKVNIRDVPAGGTVYVDSDSFSAKALKKAGFANNPLEDDVDGLLDQVKVVKLPMSSQTLEAVKHLGLSQKESLRCKNMWALGLFLWVFGRPRQSLKDWLVEKFKTKPELAEANIAALDAGHAYGETLELSSPVARYRVPKAPLESGTYRSINGSEAVAMGLLTGSHLAGLHLFLGSYPITPASNILHHLSRFKKMGVVTFQAEDEIAAVCAAIGASYAGALGVTSSSGPGIALKSEALGLAISTELPLVVINVQRGGPSTGLPTKTEQSDLYQAVMGRNGDSPVAVIAARDAADCFECAIEAVRLATRFMTPVILMMDGYIANSAEPWKIPDIEAFEPFPVAFRKDPEGFHPFLRDPETLARAWAVPGTPGLEHRIGGLEKDYETGNVSYDAINHQKMTDTRKAKIDGIARFIPEQKVAIGPESGDLAVVTWGSTHGAAHVAVERCLEEGLKVGHIHLRHMWPLPANLGTLLQGFERILVPEMNSGQLINILKAQLLRPIHGFTKVTGQPIRISELKTAITAALED